LRSAGVTIDDPLIPRGDSSSPLEDNQKNELTEQFLLGKHEMVASWFDSVFFLIIFRRLMVAVRRCSGGD